MPPGFSCFSGWPLLALPLLENLSQCGFGGLNVTGMPFSVLLRESLKGKDHVTLIFVSLALCGLCQHQRGGCTKRGSVLYTRAGFTNSKACKALGRGFAWADRIRKVSRVVGTAGIKARV